MLSYAVKKINKISYTEILYIGPTTIILFRFISTIYLLSELAHGLLLICLPKLPHDCHNPLKNHQSIQT